MYDKIGEAIQNRILEIVEDEANKILDKVGENHPKWKASRYVNVNKSNKSIKFGFGNSEADALESGSKAQAVSGTYIQNVKAHKRNLKGTMRQPKATKQRVKLSYDRKTGGVVDPQGVRITEKVRKSTEVKAHKRVYKGYKPIYIHSTGEFRMVSVIKGSKGKKILEKQVEKRLSGDGLLKLITEALNGTTLSV
tara:strand:+ start:466 stop:1047 length:582 start_codon:yes stop_codon:yes gene_type:complete